jgi:hypothetical protein
LLPLLLLLLPLLLLLLLLLPLLLPLLVQLFQALHPSMQLLQACCVVLHSLLQPGALQQLQITR